MYKRQFFYYWMFRKFDEVKTNFMHYDCDSYYQKDLFNIIVYKVNMYTRKVSS